MKAKEYAKQFKSNPDKQDALGKIIIAFMDEGMKIAEMRKAQSDKAMVAIIKEQGQKWKAFANQVEGVNPDGYIDFVKSKMPFLADFGL